MNRTQITTVRALLLGAAFAGWLIASGRADPTRKDFGHLDMTVTIDDREMYQKPFVAMKQLLKRAKESDEQLCIPSEAKRYLEIMAVPAAGQ